MRDYVNFQGSSNVTDVITCRGVINFEWKPQLVGGCQKFETVQFLRSTRNIQTNIYTHTYTRIYSLVF